MKLMSCSLFTALHATFPLLDLTEVIYKGLKFIKHCLLTFCVTVHTDNKRVLHLANLEPDCLNLRSKHYALHFHWFCFYLKPKTIELEFIKKSNIMADAISPLSFSYICKLLAHWYSNYKRD